MKIGIVCTQGGHLTESLLIMEAYDGHDLFIATHPSMRDEDLKKIALTYFYPVFTSNPFKMLGVFIWALRVMLKEKPQMLVSFGAEIAIPYFFWGKLFGVKLMYIECCARVYDISITGKMLYPIVDEFLVQWPQLLKVAGPKAKYRGGVL